MFQTCLMSKCLWLSVLFCRHWFGFLPIFHSVMKSSGSSRLARKTLTLQKSKCCDGFPVLLSTFWLAGRKRSFVFYYCCKRGNRFCGFQGLSRKCPSVTHHHFGWVEDREVKQPSDTIFIHPPPTFALFLAHGSSEGTSPGLWVLPDSYHQRVV